ncbi:hypothetical protein ACHAWU_007061 [Discostella pseudostelligera]|uniref:Pyridine nucleotide-disulphide oxidoreductase dimerisation domain-containing protein n=1 Tax=Discostella pseudostelligera TaxID=259834 RepID=A0ABD3MB91_9STRA
MDNRYYDFDLLVVGAGSEGIVTTVGIIEKKLSTGLSEREKLYCEIIWFGECNNFYGSKFSNLCNGPWDVDPHRETTSADSNELVVGLHVIGMGTDEMLQGFGIAMKMGTTTTDFDFCVAIHPTPAQVLVTMLPWGLENQTSGAKVSPLNGAVSLEPMFGSESSG